MKKVFYIVSVSLLFISVITINFNELTGISKAQAHCYDSEMNVNDDLYGEANKYCTVSGEHVMMCDCSGGGCDVSAQGTCP